MNCLFIVVDSFSYSLVQRSKLDLTPNLNKRAEKGIKCEAVYSQAPYTEAAAMALYCGQNTLSHHGYIERYNQAKTTLTEAFQHAGYEVFFNSLQPQCFPSSLRRGIDVVRYNRGYDADALWHYRCLHYADKAKSTGLISVDYFQLFRIMEDNFADWIIFLEDILNDSPSVSMIQQHNLDFCADSVLQEVREQQAKYQKDKKAYIDDILQKQLQHPIFQIPFFQQKDYNISEKTEMLYQGECRKLCNKVRLYNFIGNALSNFGVYTGIIKAFTTYQKNHDRKQLSQSLFNIKNTLVLCNHRKKYGKQCHAFKGQPSFHSHILSFLDWIDSRKSPKPFFACLHVDDIHHSEMFYTYDTDDCGIIRSELELAENYLKNRNIFTPGTVSSALSLLYVDAKCEYLIRQLEERGLDKDTMIFVTSDHGFSFSGYPIRNKLVNSFYLENFHIPFYVFGPKLHSRKITRLHSSVDIPPTICEIMGIETPESFEGQSVLKQHSSNTILIEYCGGGCPDIDNRELMIAAFDQSYFVAALVKLYDVFTADHISEVYNLKKDPLQKHNIAKTVNKKLLNQYIEAIDFRLQQIRATNDHWKETPN